jgi:two-component system, NtrC family, sensor kinase
VRPTVRARLRLALVLQAAALAAASAALFLAFGLPVAAAHALDARRFSVVVAVASVGTFLVASAIATRWLARPIERLLAAARRIGEAAELPPLGPPGDEGALGLSRAAVAFERTAAALGAERARLAEKVAELEAANADLAEAREGLRQSERLASVGLLAAGVAHEIGNPLGAISGYAELARSRLDAGATAGAADFLARIAADARRIDAIVRDLLSLARPSGLELAPVALDAAIEDALRMARVMERFRGVDVALELAPDLPRVRADARRLTQVLLNVFLNAGDAMGGAGAVRVEARAAAGRVEIRIADRGTGIPTQDLPRLFDPFFTTKAPGQGTGLGLAVSHAAMESFGGAIAAEPNPGGGAVFRLDLRAA